MRIRHVKTQADRVGFPEGSSTPVTRIHLESARDIDQALAAYRNVFELADDASVTLTVRKGAMTIDLCAANATLRTMPNGLGLCSTIMTVDRAHA